MTVSTVLIIIIAAFFVIKLFTANPLEGRWSHEDSNLVMSIRGNDTAVLEWPGEFEDADVSVTTKYSIDKQTKTFTLHVPEDGRLLGKTTIAKPGGLVVAAIVKVAQPLCQRIGQGLLLYQPLQHQAVEKNIGVGVGRCNGSIAYYRFGNGCAPCFGIGTGGQQAQQHYQ